MSTAEKPAMNQAVVDLNDQETEIEPYSALRIRIGRIVNAGVAFHEDIWSEDPEVQKKVKKFIKNNSELFHARERSFVTFFGKFLPNKLEVKTTSVGRSITPDALEKLNLKVDDIKRLAFGNPQSASEAVVVVEPKEDGDA